MNIKFHVIKYTHPNISIIYKFQCEDIENGIEISMLSIHN